MIVLFTDFTVLGPYLGQLKAALLNHGINSPIVDLISDAPKFNPRAASYLLSAYTRALPKGSIVIAVVDPGVGSDTREPVVIEANGIHFIGPGNGLFGALCQHAEEVKVYRINWRPQTLSDSFHGRDLFAPFAAKLHLSQLENNDLTSIGLLTMPVLGPADLAEIVYIDGYGNLVTGLRLQSLSKKAYFTIGNVQIRHATTFSSVSQGEPFWYVNSSGLVEIAVNSSNASKYFSIDIGYHLNVSY